MFRALTRVIPRRTTNVFRFSGELKDAKQGETKPTVSNILKEEEKSYKSPVYTRPYDKTKYEVPSNKLKVNSGTTVEMKASR